jgi:non-specific protein-tyrosine kinase
VDLRRFIGLIRSWLPLLIVAPLIAAAGAFVISNLQEKTYEARATLIVGQSLTGANPDYTQLLASQRLSETYARVATTRPVLEAVIDELGLDISADDLADAVTAEAQTDSTLVTITAQDAEPETAAAIANAVSDELIAASPAIQGQQAELLASIDADLKATQEQIRATQERMATLAALEERTPAQETELATLEGRLVSLRSTYATLLSFASSSQTNLLSVVEPAAAPDNPVGPRTLLNVALAAVLGLLLAIGIAFVADNLNDNIKDSDEVQALTGLSTLGTIGRMRSGDGRASMYQLSAILYPRSGETESYRALRTNVEFASVDAPIKTLLVTSSLPREGKTVTAANLAVVFAQAGRRVILVDADLRQPGVDKIFNLKNEQGLTTLLRSDATELESVLQGTEQAPLRILTTGPLPPNPAELLGSQRMRTIVDRLVAAADLVVFDTPPLQAVTDAAILSSWVDGTLFVIDASKSHRRAVRLARESLERAGANVLGVVLNRVAAPDKATYYGYYRSGFESGDTPPAGGALPAEGSAGRPSPS